MDRRMNSRVEISSILILFSLLVTILFAASMAWFAINVQTTEIAQSSVYLLATKDYSSFLEDDHFMPTSRGNVMKIADYNGQIQNDILKKLLPVSGAFLLLFLCLSLCLWKALNHIHNKRIMETAATLIQCENDTAAPSDPAVMSVYRILQRRFETLLDDNKRLYAYLSHEQKNTIAVLRTSLELSGHIEYLDAMDDLSNGIDDILTLSETASTAAAVPIDAALICAEVYDKYKKVYEQLSFDFDGDEDTEIMAKSRWIYRAVSNLLDNAIKYGCGNPIAFSVGVAKGSVIVKVQDHGIGIEEAQLEKIFQDRYRINELNKDGYGIGLSLVSYVCDLCGGFILAESEPGQGTTFYLSFPQKAD